MTYYVNKRPLNCGLCDFSNTRKEEISPLYCKGYYKEVAVCSLNGIDIEYDKLSVKCPLKLLKDRDKKLKTKQLRSDKL